MDANHFLIAALFFFEPIITHEEGVAITLRAVPKVCNVASYTFIDNRVVINVAPEEIAKSYKIA